ncbi:MAG: hypothetical protein N4A54_11975 [Peptostreptococcaceae bacterium]|jgi:hypothetical protein|nr:hypothetical protein [Peptostreptococcaceae bacterium]
MVGFKKKYLDEDSIDKLVDLDSNKHFIQTMINRQVNYTYNSIILIESKEDYDYSLLHLNLLEKLLKKLNNFKTFNSEELSKFNEDYRALKNILNFVSKFKSNDFKINN